MPICDEWELELAARMIEALLIRKCCVPVVLDCINDFEKDVNEADEKKISNLAEYRVLVREFRIGFALLSSGMGLDRPLDYCSRLGQQSAAANLENAVDGGSDGENVVAVKDDCGSVGHVAADWKLVWKGIVDGMKNPIAYGCASAGNGRFSTGGERSIAGFGCSGAGVERDGTDVERGSVGDESISTGDERSGAGDESGSAGDERGSAGDGCGNAGSMANSDFEEEEDGQAIVMPVANGSIIGAETSDRVALIVADGDHRGLDPLLSLMVTGETERLLVEPRVDCDPVGEVSNGDCFAVSEAGCVKDSLEDVGIDGGDERCLPSCMADGPIIEAGAYDPLLLSMDSAETERLLMEPRFDCGPVSEKKKGAVQDGSCVPLVDKRSGDEYVVSTICGIVDVKDGTVTLVETIGFGEEVDSLEAEGWKITISKKHGDLIQKGVGILTVEPNASRQDGRIGRRDGTLRDRARALMEFDPG